MSRNALYKNQSLSHYYIWIFVSPSNHVKVEKSVAALQVRLNENVLFPQNETDINKRLNLSAEEGETFLLAPDSMILFYSNFKHLFFWIFDLHYNFLKGDLIKLITLACFACMLFQKCLHIFCLVKFPCISMLPVKVLGHPGHHGLRSLVRKAPGLGVSWKRKGLKDVQELFLPSSLISILISQKTKSPNWLEKHKNTILMKMLLLVGTSWRQLF